LLPDHRAVLRALKPIRNALSGLDEQGWQVVGHAHQPDQIAAWIGQKITAEAATRAATGPRERGRWMEALDTLENSLLELLGLPDGGAWNGSILGGSPLTELRRLHDHAPGEYGLGPLISALARVLEIDSRVALHAELYPTATDVIDAFETRHPYTDIHGVNRLRDSTAHVLVQTLHQVLVQYPIRLPVVRVNVEPHQTDLFAYVV